MLFAKKDKILENFKIKLTIAGIVLAFSSFILINSSLKNLFSFNNKILEMLFNGLMFSLFNSSTIVLMLSLILGGFYLTHFNFIKKEIILSLFNVTFDWSILFNLILLLIIILVKSFQSNTWIGLYVLIFLISIFIIDYLAKKGKIKI